MNDIERFRKRRAARIASRFDGGFISFVYGWLRNEGVQTKGMEPSDAITKFNEMRGGENGQEGKPVSIKGDKRPKEIKRSQFIKALKQAKATVDKKDAWRVSLATKEEYEEDHPGAHFYSTKDGATVAVDREGDIISACAIPGKAGGVSRGKQILQFAVEHGGKKLDSFAGNHGFYTKCGFEPVSWCEFADIEGIRPDDWNRERDDKEPVIFYKYVGVGNVKKEFLDVDNFLRSVKPSEDYGVAKAERNRRMK